MFQLHHCDYIQKENDCHWPDNGHYSVTETWYTASDHKEVYFLRFLFSQKKKDENVVMLG